jgi:hypothetical protein
LVRRFFQRLEAIDETLADSLRGNVEELNAFVQDSKDASQHFVAVDVVAALLSQDESAIRAAVGRGEIVAVGVGQDLSVPVSEFLRLLSDAGALRDDRTSGES